MARNYNITYIYKTSDPTQTILERAGELVGTNVAGGNYEKSLIATTLKAIGTGIDKIKGSDKPREFTLTPTYKDNLGMSVGGTATMTPSEKPVNPWEKPVREKVPKLTK